MPITYSVVIPAYNAEKTLARCLDSLLQEKRADVELILVNDGSRDNTHEICQEYAGKYPQIRYFSKKNGGVSSARNLGIANAKGTFITFVDSDDYVSAAYFSVLDRNLTGDCDFLMFGKSIFDGRESREYLLEDWDSADPQQIGAALAGALRRQLLNAPCNKVFRRLVLAERGLRFDERLPIGEDKVFVVQYLTGLRWVRFIREPLYTISTENEQSLSRKKRENLCDHILLEHELLFAAAERSEYRRQLLPAVTYSYYRSAYTVIREMRKFDYPRKERLRRTAEICRRYAARRDCVFGGWKDRLLSLPVRLRLARLIDFALK